MIDLSPPSLDRLASEYVLGTLQGGARRRFQQLIQSHSEVRDAVAAWEGRLHQLAVSVPSQAPRPAVWDAIEVRTRSVPRVQPQATPWWSGLFGSVAKAALGAAFGVLVVVGLLRVAPETFMTVDQLAQREQVLPQSYVGLLLDAEGRPSLLVSSTRHGTRVTVKSLRAVEVPAGKILQVWALPKEGVPFAIGVATVTQPPGSTAFELKDSSEALLSKVTQLAVSLEDAPAGPGAAPKEPLLFKGHCVKLW